MVRENLQCVRMGEYAVFVVNRALRYANTIPVLAIAAILLFCSPASPQNTSNDSTTSAGDFLRRAIDGELKAQADDHTHWMYRERTGAAGDQVKSVVETREGDVDRLCLVNGQAITPEQAKQEDQRIARLLRKRGEQKKRKRAQEEDARQTEHLFKMLPDAVIASYGENKGDVVEIIFKPNPDFRPSSHEDAVFHAMAGRIWINRKEDRLVEIEGHLIQNVTFAGGLLGHLDKGGEFHVRQSEVAPGHWEVTLLQVHMRGKALFFKTIAVQQDEIRTDFRQVPDSLTLAQAAEELQKQSTEKSIADKMQRVPTGSLANSQTTDAKRMDRN
jgi:hypothetical protein